MEERHLPSGSCTDVGTLIADIKGNPTSAHFCPIDYAKWANTGYGIGKSLAKVPGAGGASAPLEIEPVKY